MTSANQGRNLASLLRERLERAPATVEDPSERLDAGALLSRADALAAELRRHGITPDEPVMIGVGNRAADIAAFLGVWTAGGVAIPIHASSPAAVVETLRAATATRLIVEGATGDVTKVAAEPPPQRPLLDGAALVILTSGSTGTPKGVVIGHDRFAAKLDALQGMLGFTPRTDTLLPLQVTFIFGIWAGLLTILAGGRLRMMPKFTPAAVRAALEDGVTTAALVPTMLRALFASEGQVPSAPRLRQILTGGEPLGGGLAAMIGEAFPDAGLFDLYGLTETGSCDFHATPEIRAAAAGTIGLPTPGVEFRIDATTGELLIRTPFGMLGYLDQPDLTAASFDDGWFRTGDLARLHPLGHVELVGRAKDIISRGGNKIAPMEIDRLFCGHPDVAAALTTGVPDPLLGERLHVLIVPRAGATLDAGTLAGWATGRIERFKIPDAFHFAPELPLGRTGKADRGALRGWINDRIEKP
ncbi:AMP-dependent synthetase [Skermanella stibiiresistens SB22]|uniref:AMP-dependent synthetase n=1 Tax=Skermanella stibiiresistens SB22 TaxID=1385369 RepID=W9H8R9_9PROT|nr:class I adenylate-forming enzyme family protein [Skermanella stibiiresistens]EWY42454.1 AMP-dependent synthetase [Skermanella stibiiresistens SB22]